MTPTVAIVGRPNVGKSTLFNRLVGKKLALVDDRPGVTRDRREGEARLGDLEFRIIDTAGLEEATEESLLGRMRAQTEAAIVDGRLRLGAHAAQERLLSGFFQPCRIDDAEFEVAETSLTLTAVAGYARAIVHERQLFADETIE